MEQNMANKEENHLTNGNRQPKGIGTVDVTITMPKMTLEMLDRLANVYNKTRSAYANYLIWCGYHALRGTFEKPKRQPTNET
jgi:hypothetical protein